MRGPGHRPALRLISILGVFTFIFVAIASRLVYLQVVRAAPLGDLGEEQRIVKIELPAKRGSILDRNLDPLAVSTDARAVYAEPRSLMSLDPPADVDAMAAQIAPILGLSEEWVAGQLGKPDTNFAYLARRVAPSVAERVMALRLPHILSLKETMRTYPADDLAGQVLGFVNVDNVGLSGIESMYNGVVSGIPGQQIIERDPRGRPIPQGQSSIVEPSPGLDVVLTLDRNLQFYAEEALARGAIRTTAESGTAIVLDVRSGDVLAMANWPPLNPNEFGDATSDERRNRAVTDVYEPGSVNKVITAAAAIESGVASPGTELVVPDSFRIADKVFSDFESHPTERLTYSEGLARSSNIATIKVAQRLGRARLYDALDRFGLGRTTGVGYPGESPGILARPGDWWPTSMGTIPIGQGIAATPLQIASVYQTIANDGVRIAPRLRRATIEPDGTVVEAPPSETRRVVSAFAAAQVRGMLVGVVEHGTGTKTRIPGYLVGGKTGTARVPFHDHPGYSRDIITTFVGMAPANDPRLVVLVQLYDPYPRYASDTAAPVFREIMQYALGAMGVPMTVGQRDDTSLSLRRAVAPPRPPKKHRARTLATREVVATVPERTPEPAESP